MFSAVFTRNVLIHPLSSLSAGNQTIKTSLALTKGVEKNKKHAVVRSNAKRNYTLCQV